MARILQFRDKHWCLDHAGNDRRCLDPSLRQSLDSAFQAQLAPVDIASPFTHWLQFLLMDAQSFREALTDAIRYWEPRRLVYNAVLAAIVLACFWIGYPKSKETLTINLMLLVFLLAVLANVAYCAAYVPDIFAQLSGFREPWRKYRWIVLLIGLLFASVITRFWALAFFSAYNS